MLCIAIIVHCKTDMTWRYMGINLHSHHYLSAHKLEITKFLREKKKERLSREKRKKTPVDRTLGLLIPSKNIRNAGDNGS